VNETDLLDTALGAADFRQAMHAARQLGSLPAERLRPLLPALAAALQAPVAHAVRRAALVHAALGGAAADNAPALLAVLSSPRWPVREAAALALGRVAPAAAREALLQRALFDRSAAVRDAAVGALEADTDALATITAHLGHRHPRVRCRALRLSRVLAAVPDAVTALLRGLEDSHFRVRRDAASLLADLGPSALPALPRLLRCRFDHEPRVARAASAALAHIAPTLPAPLPDWLARLNRSEESAATTLRELLNTGELPADVEQAFAEACQRRARWHSSRPGAEVPSGVPLEQALTASGRSEKEAAWLVGWLWERLVRHYHDTSR
jgi:HEAT repeat protein